MVSIAKMFYKLSDLCISALRPRPT